MHQLSNDQYFLLIPEINLFPEIQKDTITMIEQLMNALLLSHKNNIQHAIDLIIGLELSCKSLINYDYVFVLEKIKPMLNENKIFIAQGEEVRTMYPRYHKLKYFWDVGKQAAMNLEFSLEKKLSYCGKKIKWEVTYADWINDILNKQRENGQYNSCDRLLYNLIEPLATIKYIETRQIIENETKKYAKEYRKALLLQKDMSHE